MRKLKVKLKDLCFKKPFYKHLYQHIKDEFAYNNKTAIRYYMDANTMRDESFKFEIELYHKVYCSPFDSRYLETIFMFTKNYISEKISKYSDLQFIYGEDEYGLYFEVAYMDGY
ncbi:hypothetical protein QH639_18340 [Lysinibacillus sp. 1 U-2021]|uniref:hypothetical protein n=1 Tax=Lysinibacillus sp. 1 U-2021 TaxID=3039426 RepID=UPI0024813949|nr:hypothetical protein [Lysinibacillus sp. 1 U-2021]WGT37780.1 hypothetical protein QH639_18340 [Lysinibacillus sp. 1 U-2021]